MQNPVPHPRLAEREHRYLTRDPGEVHVYRSLKNSSVKEL